MSYAVSGRPKGSDHGERHAAVKYGLVLECVDTYRLAEFWTAALGYVRRGSSGSESLLVDPAALAPELVLREIDQLDGGKNRLHFDIHAADVDSEVERLIALGAKRDAP